MNCIGQIEIFSFSTFSLSTVMEDLPITLGKLHGGLNENAGENTGVRMGSVNN